MVVCFGIAESSSDSKVTQNTAVPVPAPVVVTKSAVTLAERMDLKNLPLSTTPGGRSFVLKSLHPADSEIKSTRAPGGMMPSLALSCDMIDTIPFPPNAVSCAIIQTPNIMFPASLVFYDINDNYVDHYIWANAALGGNAHPIHAPTLWSSIISGLTNLDSKIVAYRTTAQSITCDVIAPAVANQGTITSAQFREMPLTASPCEMDMSSAPPKILQATDVWYYNEAPSHAQLLMGTSAYTAKAVEGFYQPLKLTKFKWVNVNDAVMFLTDANVDRVCDSVARNFTLGNYPIYFNALTPDPKVTEPMSKPSDHTVGLTYIEGTAGNPQVSLRIRLRQVCEIVPKLGGVYAPLAEAPLPPDELCFKMLKEIGGKMKDAYPASYNDWGKIKDKILSIGKGVLKFADPILDVMSFVPGAGTVVGAIRKGVDLAKGIQSAFDAPKLPPRDGTRDLSVPAPRKPMAKVQIVKKVRKAKKRSGK